MKRWTTTCLCTLVITAAGCEKTPDVDKVSPGAAAAPGSPAAGAQRVATVTADHVEFTLPLRELQMRPGEPMVAIHADRNDGGAVSLILVFDPAADSGIHPAIVLIDAARHAVGASYWEMHGDATSTGGPIFLDGAEVDGDRLIIREAGPLHDLITKERPETLQWRPGGESDAAPARYMRVEYAKGENGQ